MNNTKNGTDSDIKQNRVLISCGLLAILGSLLMAAIVAMVIFPPWNEVQCKRRQLLYSSEVVQVLESSFVGFDVIWSKAKRQSTSTPANPNSGSFFQSHEFRISRGILCGEVAIAFATAFAIFLVLRQRLL